MPTTSWKIGTENWIEQEKLFKSIARRTHVAHVRGREDGVHELALLLVVVAWSDTASIAITL